jgi:hypothetical protein
LATLQSRFTVRSDISNTSLISSSVPAKKRNSNNPRLHTVIGTLAVHAERSHAVQPSIHGRCQAGLRRGVSALSLDEQLLDPWFVHVARPNTSAIILKSLT